MIRQLARLIRHTPGLDRLDGIWDVVRPVYLRLIDPRGSGVTVKVGGVAVVSMPGVYAGGDWERYEPTEMKAVTDWLAANPGSLFVDVGCAIGIYSLVALTYGAKVIAIDSDLSALKSTLRMCANTEQPTVLWGFASSTNVSKYQDIESLSYFTLLQIKDSKVTGDVGTNRYVCIGDPTAETVPTHALGHILPARNNTLIKCDIEGAELLMLMGMAEYLTNSRPTLCLSVHPPALGQYGHDVKMVRDFLALKGYTIEVLGVDHEEHWWCSPRDLSAQITTSERI